MALRRSLQDRKLPHLAPNLNLSKVHEVQDEVELLHAGVPQQDRGLTLATQVWMQQHRSEHLEQRR